MRMLMASHRPWAHAACCVRAQVRRVQREADDARAALATAEDTESASAEQRQAAHAKDLEEKQRTLNAASDQAASAGAAAEKHRRAAEAAAASLKALLTELHAAVGVMDDEPAAAAPPSRRADFPSRASSLPFPYANHAPPVSTLFSLTLISVTMDIDT